jgi:tetratricopeptide (TPR) repeat protein
MFVLLVVVFGAGFVFLGVGSGGLDLGSLLRDAFGKKGSSAPSLSKAREDVAKHPRNAAAYKKLADALEAKGQTAQAITTLEQYVKLKPKDTTQLTRLGRLEFTQAANLQNAAQVAYLDQQAAGLGSSLGVAPTGKFGQALGTDPIQSAVSSKSSTESTQAFSKYQAAATAAVKTFKRLAKVRPGVSSLLALAQAAQQFSDSHTAVAAYKKLLKLETDPTIKAEIRAKIKALQPTPTTTKPRKKHGR